MLNNLTSTHPYPSPGIQTVEQQLGPIVFHAGTRCHGDQIVTSGGRVLAVVAMENNLAVAKVKALLGASSIQYEGKFFRKDIADKVLKR